MCIVGIKEKEGLTAIQAERQVGGLYTPVSRTTSEQNEE